MKQGWELKKLGDVCDVIGGGTPSKGNGKFYNGNILWATVRDMKKDILNDTEHKITTDAVVKSSTNIIPKGNVIIATRVGLGKVCLIEKNTAINQDLKGIIPKIKSVLSVGYLYQWFKSISHLIVEEGTGATVQGVKLPFIKDLKIPLPSLDEQHLIVSILEEVFAAITSAKANAEQNLKNAKELFESYLQGVFSNMGEGWEVKRLGEVCEYDKLPNKVSDLPYVGLEDIQSNTGKLIGPLTPRSVKSLTFHFTSEHVLYGRLRPYLNKVLLPDFEGHCSTEIFPIKPKKYILDRSFLFRWLIATETMNKINATWTGATLPRANMNIVLDFKINIPPLLEQQTIVQKLDALSSETKKLEAIYQQKINDLEELKKSVLQKAFIGELNTKNAVVV